MKSRMLAQTAVVLLAAFAPILAHHSVAAEYDISKTATFSGKIANVAWTNPHANIFVDVASADGKTNRWTVEIGAPNKITGMRSHLTAGDPILVEAWTAKDGSLHAHAVSLTFADGTKVDAIDTWDKLSMLSLQNGDLQQKNK